MRSLLITAGAACGVAAALCALPWSIPLLVAFAGFLWAAGAPDEDDAS